MLARKNSDWNLCCRRSVGSRIGSFARQASGPKLGMERRRGTSLVEFALILPVLMILVVGLIDLGRGWSMVGVISNAAREGARFGSSHPLDNPGIKNRVMEEAKDSGITLYRDRIAIFVNGIEVPDERPANSAISIKAGEPVKVQVTTRYTPMFTWLLGKRRIRLVRQCTMAAFGDYQDDSDQVFENDEDYTLDEFEAETDPDDIEESDDIEEEDEPPAPPPNQETDPDQTPD